MGPVGTCSRPFVTGLLHLCSLDRESLAFLGGGFYFPSLPLGALIVVSVIQDLSLWSRIDFTRFPPPPRVFPAQLLVTASV